MSAPLVIFLHSAQYDRLYQAVNLLVTASSMGRKCYVFLFYDALASFMAGTWDELASVPPGDDAPDWARTLQRNFDLADTPSLYEILERARGESGGLTVCACSTSTRMLDLEPADVKARVDEIIGLATMLDIAQEPARVLYI